MLVQMQTSPDNNETALRFTFDAAEGSIAFAGRTLPLADPKAMEIVSNAWLRVGWDQKYVYGFSWMGRPTIQLPEDLIRLQELVWSQKPDVIIETGVAHGGTTVFLASVLETLGAGLVIGVDVEIRPHNREELEKHPLFHRISLVEGDSTDSSTLEAVRKLVPVDARVMVILDSDHSRAHVRRELDLYGSLVQPDGLLLVCDGIMAGLVGAPRSEPDWSVNNPLSAVKDFLSENPDFELVEPTWPFNESLSSHRVTYWPSGTLRRK